jgi:hypothetical protein
MLVVTVLTGLIAAGTGLPAIADEATDRTELEVDLVGPTPALTTRALRTAVSHSVRHEAPMDAAILELFCLEARDAVQRGQLGRQRQQWVLINGHRCRDERLLFDALGF